MSKTPIILSTHGVNLETRMLVKILYVGTSDIPV